jgi:protease-4
MPARPHRPRRTPALAILSAALAAALAALTGCNPSVDVNVGFTPSGPLRENTILTEAADRAASAKVALIDLRGLIADANTPGLLGEGPNPVDEVVRRLARAADDASVKAVVLRISSPGGTVTGSDILYAEVRRFRATTGKPVVVSMGEVAASGGYYVALAGDWVLAQPTTLTGSIGVIIPTINASEGLGRIGVYSRAVKSGVNKDLANPLEPAREGQYAVLQQVVDEMYVRFRSLVVERRPALDPARLDEATDGRIVTGQRALDLGLVDALGGVREAFDEARRLAGVERARLVKYSSLREPGERSPYALLADAPAHGALGSASGGGGGGAGEREINLFQIRLNDAAIGTGIASDHAGVYYLWSPALWGAD